MFKNRFRKHGSDGFVHHFGLIALLVIVGFGIFGAYQLVASHADTLSYATSTRAGCTLTGRDWNGDTTTCTKNCNGSGSTFVANGAALGYCSGHIAPSIGLSNCSSTLHRKYVDNVGCARRADRLSTNNAVQCQEAYPNYKVVPGSDDDKCVATPLLTLPPPTPTPTHIPTPTPTPTPGTDVRVVTDAVSKTDCTTLLGRRSTTEGCTRICQQKELKQVTLLAAPAPDNGICQGWIATRIAKTHCTVNLHRIWRDNGCLRHIPQVDTANAPQCAPGYPYYNVNFTSHKRTTGIDVCEKSQAVAQANEKKDILGSPALSATYGTGTTANDDTGCTKAETTCLPDHGEPGGETHTPPTGGHGTPTDPTVPHHDTSASGTVSIEKISRDTCELLGRDWEPASGSSDGTKNPAGCSTETCFRQKLDLHKRNGSFYCDGYAVGLAQQKCQDLHRKWIDRVTACATRPNQNNKPGTRVVKAPQCAGGFTTYVYRANQYDECLRPGTVDNLKNVARVSGLPFVKVTTLSRAGLCNVLPHKHWNGHGCVADVKTHVATTTSTSTTSSTVNHSAAGFHVTATFCTSLGRHLVGSTCSSTCDNTNYHRDASTAAANHGYDKCVPNTSGSGDTTTPSMCPHNDPDCRPSTNTSILQTSCDNFIKHAGNGNYTCFWQMSGFNGKCDHGPYPPSPVVHYASWSGKQWTAKVCDQG